MSCGRALNFDQWKTFSENYKPMRVSLWVLYKFTENYYRLRLFSEFIQTRKMYPIRGRFTTPNNKLLLWFTLITSHICTSCQSRNYGSRTIASEENCPQNLTLTQTLTHREGGGGFPRGQFSRHQKLHNILCYVHY